jgi:hypothetical protein
MTILNQGSTLLCTTPLCLDLYNIPKIPTLETVSYLGSPFWVTILSVREGWRKCLLMFSDRPCVQTWVSVESLNLLGGVVEQELFQRGFMTKAKSFVSALFQ